MNVRTLSVALVLLAVGSLEGCSDDSSAASLECTDDRTEPVDVSGLASGVRAIAASSLHTCALATSGGVRCWGNNYWGQLGDGSTTTRMVPVDVSGLTSGVVAIAAGDDHTCALTNEGGVRCWGINLRGQLGDGSSDSSTEPVNVSGLASGVKAIAAGASHTCALTAEGGARCWGDNEFGELGDGSTTDRAEPVDVSGLASGVTAITAGGGHTCALTNEGGVMCWGSNSRGQLGDGSTDSSTEPVNVSGLASGVKAIAAGADHTCAVTTAGGVRCWGNNEYGQAGDGSTTDRTVPVDVSGLASGVEAIAAGDHHTCVVTTAGGVRCWGINLRGQLGDGSTTNRTKPVNVSGLASGVKAIAAGWIHTCALTTEGGVRCWGNNSRGQLGACDSSASSSDGPNSCVPGTIAACSCGGNTGAQTCLSDGTLGPCDCQAECVQNTDCPTSRPICTPTLTCVECRYNSDCREDEVCNNAGECVPISVTETASMVSAGGLYTCALTTAGGVKCWGGNSHGQLGDGSETDRSTPSDVSGLTGGVIAISSGHDHACALTAGNAVKCWGRNSFGQLGDGGDASRSTPADVSGISSGASAVSAGGSHTCALTTRNEVKCWGRNRHGGLGDGSTTNRSSAVDVLGLAGDVVAIASGDAFTCALMAGGGVRCWGSNEIGTLGDGSTADSSTPVDVAGLASGVVAITAGDDHACALTVGGGVKCWGWNGIGGLGDGSTTDRSSPVDVVGLTSGVVAISAGDAYTCALTAGGGVKCWGDNSDGQLGDASGIDSSIPVDVSGLASGIVAISAGFNHACALTTGGSLKCWGLNSSGQLGEGPSTSLVPIEVIGF